MKQRRTWDLAWAAWLTGTVGSFAVLEYLAYHRRLHPTLSATLRRWMGVDPRASRHVAMKIGFAGFWVWLTVHVTRSR